MLVVQLDRLAVRAEQLRETLPLTSFPGLERIGADGQFADQVEVELRAQLVSSLVIVQGELRTALTQQCGLCLDDFARSMKVPVDLAFAQQEGIDQLTDEVEDRELHSDELGLILFTGDELDLSVALTEQLLLAIPYRPVCGRACRGLCSRCGANLNQASCSCEAEEGLNPFAVLKNLDIEKGEE